MSICKMCGVNPSFVGGQTGHDYGHCLPCIKTYIDSGRALEFLNKEDAWIGIGEAVVAPMPARLVEQIEKITGVKWGA